MWSSRQRFKQLLVISCLLLSILIFGSAFLSTHTEYAPKVQNSFGRWFGTIKPDHGDSHGENHMLSSSIESGDGIDEDHANHHFEGFEGGMDDEEEDGNDQKEHEPDFDFEDEDLYSIPDRGDYRELFSLTTRTREGFPVFIEGSGVYDPNIIPHPTKSDMWILVAQRIPSDNASDISEQLVCIVGLLDGVLICAEDPITLPLSPSIHGSCEDDLAWLNELSGAKDVRMLYGPDAPYVVYGSQSQYTCLGIWLQDARTLLQPFHLERPLITSFKAATEVRRPAPFNGVEEKYFIFWDNQGRAYAHQELWPERVFAQIEPDGDVGENLAPLAARKDQVCMAKYMPDIEADMESISQAANSLSITLCKRKDSKCTPDDSNTFIMALFNREFHYDSHTVYDPYVLLFQRTAPFALHAISQRPLWIHGRDALTALSGSRQYEGREIWIPEGHTEMFSITSMSWMTHGQKYHGFVDDVLLLAYGIEDSRAAAIDVTAGDLLQDLDFC